MKSIRIGLDLAKNVFEVLLLISKISLFYGKRSSVPKYWSFLLSRIHALLAWKVAVERTTGRESFRN